MTVDLPARDPTLLRSVADDLRSSWKPLLLTSAAFKLLALVLLTPLIGILFRLIIAMSGEAALADVDILLFLVRPLGWISAVIVGGLWLAILALEQTALLGMIRARTSGRTMGVLRALQFAAAHAWPVIRLTARIVASCLLLVAPFFLVAATTYFLLLTQFDINYYLKEKPPVFLVAVSFGVLIAVAVTLVLLRLMTGWFFALPIVLFRGQSPKRAIELSDEQTKGHRRLILAWIVGWFVATIALTTAAGWLAGLLGQSLIPDANRSLHLLQIAVGIVLLVWSTSTLAVNVLCTTTFAAILFRLNRHLGSGEPTGTSTPVAASWAIADDADGGAGLSITPRRFFAASIVGVAVAMASGSNALHSVRLDDDVEVMAHRGSSQAAPENTMAAFRRAIDDGADWIELDVQETADGEVVVLHDRDFMKLAGEQLKIWDATMKDLTEIDIGSWFSTEFQGERVPTLAEVLDECKGRIRVNIELKYYGHDRQLEQRVIEIVESRGMSSDVAVMSLKMAAVRKMKTLRPNWNVGLLMSVSAGALRNIEADFLAVNARFVRRDFVRAAHRSGKAIYVWTVNDPLTMSAMISRGVDGILTDKPALAREVLQQRAEMSGPERLLLELAGKLGAKAKIIDQ